ncbi:hypothetical protein [Geodermatophilus sp. SYSU D01176]
MPIRLLVAHTPAERDAARTVEGRVFLQAFGNTPEVMEQEYGPFEARSRFVVVLDEESGTALGAARLILPDPAGPVKTLADVAGEPWRVDVGASLRTAGLASGPVWDVASLAVDRRFRSGAAGAELTLALCHGILEHPRICGAEGLVTVLDDKVLRLLRVMGVPWGPLPGATSQPYLGSPASTPCVMRVDAVGPSIRARRPDVAPAVVDGLFSSILLDPADLVPGRGAPLAEADPLRPPGRPIPPRRDTTQWRPPTQRRSVATGPTA